MKRCPECRRDYFDGTLSYCLDNGTARLEGPAPGNEPMAAILSEFRIPPSGTSLSEAARAEPRNNFGMSSEKQSPFANRAAKPLIALAISLAILIAGFFSYRYFPLARGQINSIAVMPFVNESGNNQRFRSLHSDPRFHDLLRRVGPP